MNRRGVTLIELLMAIVIGAIAMFALVPPLVAERVFWGNTQRQTEAQRDAQMGMRAIARVARTGQSYTVLASGPPSGTLEVKAALGTFYCFEGGPASSFQFRMRTGPCGAGGGGVTPTTFIDGVRSKVTNFTITPLTGKLVRLHLEVTHILQTTDPRTPGKEILETDLFLRNAT